EAVVLPETAGPVLRQGRQVEARLRAVAVQGLRVEQIRQGGGAEIGGAAAVPRAGLEIPRPVDAVVGDDVEIRPEHLRAVVRRTEARAAGSGAGVPRDGRTGDVHAARLNVAGPGSAVEVRIADEKGGGVHDGPGEIGGQNRTV